MYIYITGVMAVPRKLLILLGLLIFIHSPQAATAVSKMLDEKCTNVKCDETKICPKDSALPSKPFSTDSHNYDLIQLMTPLPYFRAKRDLYGQCCAKERCVCKHCLRERPKCKPEQVLLVVRSGNGLPGSCCDQFKCVDEEPVCTDPKGSVKYYINDNCAECDSCNEAPCIQICNFEEGPMSDCRTEDGQWKNKGDQWTESDGCRECICDGNNRKMCVETMCKPPECKNARRREGECCPTCPEQWTTKGPWLMNSSITENNEGMVDTTENMVQTNSSELSKQSSTEESSSTEINDTTTVSSKEVSPVRQEHDSTTEQNAVSSIQVEESSTKFRFVEGETTYDISPEILQNEMFVNTVPSIENKLQTEILQSSTTEIPDTTMAEGYNELDHTEEEILLTELFRHSAEKPSKNANSLETTVLNKEIDPLFNMPDLDTSSAVLDFPTTEATALYTGSGPTTEGPTSSPSPPTPESTSQHKDFILNETDYRWAKENYKDDQLSYKSEKEVVVIGDFIIKVTLTLIVLIVVVTGVLIIIQKRQKKSYSSVPGSDPNLSQLTRTSSLHSGIEQQPII